MIYPFLSYHADIDGVYLQTLTLPGQCVLDCSGSGRNDDAVARWAPEIERPATLTPDVLRRSLREVGAWSVEELEDDAQNWHRAIWLASHSMADDDDPDACVVLPLTADQKEDLRELAWAETGRDATAMHLMDVATDCTDLDAWPNLKTDREQVLTLLEEDPSILDRAADYLRPFLDQPEVAGVAVEWDEDSACWDSEWVAITRAIQEADKTLWDEEVARDIRKLCAYVGAPIPIANRAVEAMETSVRTIMAWTRDHFRNPNPQR